MFVLIGQLSPVFITQPGAILPQAIKKENEKTKQNTKKPIRAVIDNTLRRAVYVYPIFINGVTKIKSEL